MKQCGSPQEKKRLSYSRDRRTWYGENDKSSRKSAELDSGHGSLDASDSWCRITRRSPA